jgi:hypothetical protein
MGHRRGGAAHAAGAVAALERAVRLPSFLTSQFVGRVFNEVVYRWNTSKGAHILHPERFFYPLDAIRHWNRLYGRRGFHPASVGAAGFRRAGSRAPAAEAAHGSRRRVVSLRDQGLR